MEILGHFQTSVRRALDEIDPDYMAYNGLIVCGSHSPKELDTGYLLEAIRDARERSRPFLGICFGHQMAAIEYARNVLGIKDATSEEFGTDGYPVVVKRTGLKVGLHEGETYWSNYEVQMPDYWRQPQHFLTTPAHPEYQSSIGNPHPLLVDFIDLCKQ